MQISDLKVLLFVFSGARRLEYFQDNTLTQQEDRESSSSLLCQYLQRLHMNLETVHWPTELQTILGRKTGTCYCYWPTLAVSRKERVSDCALLWVLLTQLVYFKKIKWMSSLVLQVSNMESEKLPLHLWKWIYLPHTNFQTAFCEELFYCMLITKDSKQNSHVLWNLTFICKIKIH